MYSRLTAQGASRSYLLYDVRIAVFRKVGLQIIVYPDKSFALHV